MKIKEVDSLEKKLISLFKRCESSNEKRTVKRMLQLVDHIKSNADSVDIVVDAPKRKPRAKK